MTDSAQLSQLLDIGARMSPVIKEITKQLKGLTDLLDQVDEESKKAQRGFQKFVQVAATQALAMYKKLAMPMKAVAGAIASAGDGIGKFITANAKAADAVYEGAKQAGISVQAYQRLGYVADQSGVSAEAMQGAMRNLNMAVGQAASGSAPKLAKLFSELNIATKDSNHHLRASQDILPQVASALMQTTDPVQRSRMGIALLGQDWEALLPMLQQGGKGIEQLSQRFASFGAGMSEQDIKAAREWRNLMTDLGLAAGGLQTTIATELLPVLRPLIEDLIRWIAANKGAIAEGLKTFIKDFGAALQNVDWKSFGVAINSIGDAIVWALNHFELLKNALIGLAVLMSLGTIKSTLGLAGAIGQLGVNLVGLGLQALAPIAPLQTAAGIMKGMLPTAGKLVGLFGRLGAAGGLALAAKGGWEVGKLANEHAINPLARWLTGDKDATLGTALYDFFNPDPNLSKTQSSLAHPSANQISGTVSVSFQNAPAGMKVVQTTTSPGLALTANVGQRTPYSQAGVY